MTFMNKKILKVICFGLLNSVYILYSMEKDSTNLFDFQRFQDNMTLNQTNNSNVYFNDSSKSELKIHNAQLLSADDPILRFTDVIILDRKPFHKHQEGDNLYIDDAALQHVLDQYPFETTTEHIFTTGYTRLHMSTNYITLKNGLPRNCMEQLAHACYYNNPEQIKDALQKGAYVSKNVSIIWARKLLLTNAPLFPFLRESVQELHGTLVKYKHDKLQLWVKDLQKIESSIDSESPLYISRYVLKKIKKIEQQCTKEVAETNRKIEILELEANVHDHCIDMLKKIKNHDSHRITQLDGVINNRLKGAETELLADIQFFNMLSLSLKINSAHDTSKIAIKKMKHNLQGRKDTFDSFFSDTKTRKATRVPTIDELARYKRINRMIKALDFIHDEKNIDTDKVLKIFTVIHAEQSFALQKIKKERVDVETLSKRLRKHLVLVQENISKHKASIIEKTEIEKQINFATWDRDLCPQYKKLSHKCNSLRASCLELLENYYACNKTNTMNLSEKISIAPWTLFAMGVIDRVADRVLQVESPVVLETKQLIKDAYQRKENQPFINQLRLKLIRQLCESANTFYTNHFSHKVEFCSDALLPIVTQESSNIDMLLNATERFPKRELILDLSIIAHSRLMCFGKLLEIKTCQLRAQSMSINEIVVD